MNIDEIRRRTYRTQLKAAALFAGAVLLGTLSYLSGSYVLVAFNFVCGVTLLWIIVWNARIRARLP